MKKKILSFILAICFIIPCAFALSGCGDNEKEEPLPTAELKSKNAIMANLGDKYTVSYKTSSGASAEYDETVTIVVDGDDTYYNYVGSSYSSTSLYHDNLVYSLSTSMEGSYTYNKYNSLRPDTYGPQSVEYQLAKYYDSISYKSMETEIFLGRECTHYVTVTMSGWDADVIIENETGFVLKFKDSGNNAGNFEITSIQENVGDLSAEPSKILIEKYDADDYATYGLSQKVEVPAGYVWVSSSVSDYKAVTHTYELTSADGVFDLVTTAFFDYGANLKTSDAQSAETSKGTLITNDGFEAFEAYTSAGYKFHIEVVTTYSGTYLNVAITAPEN